MKKRRNGEGSWGQKTIKGVIYQYYRDSNGRYTYGKTVKQVKEKLKEKNEIINNLPEDVKIEVLGISVQTTFEDYVKHWLKSRKDIEKTTLQSYENALENRFYNFKHCKIAKRQLRAITNQMLQDYIDTLAEHYSKNSVLKTWSPLKQCLKDAIKKKQVPNDLLLDLKLPKEHACKVKTKEIEVIEDIHVEMIYNEAYRKFANGRPVYGNSAKVVCLIMYTGLRISEALALKWEDIDFEKKTMKIDSAMATIKEDEKYVLVEKGTKRESSNRIIPLPLRAIDVLKDLEKTNPKHKKKDFVCITSNKTLLRRRNVSRALAGILKSLDIEENYTLHSLRHGYGSILLSKGLDIKLVAELLGHKDVTTTYNIYIKIYNKDKIKAAEIFDKLEEKDENDNKVES